MLSYFVKVKHRHTLEAIFTTPTKARIVFSEIEALVTAIGGEVREGAGSRVVFELKGSRRYLHRPHPENIKSKSCASGSDVWR
jgi:hypothetical protein